MRCSSGTKALSRHSTRRASSKQHSAWSSRTASG
jgi:hypothetical protein